MKDFTESNETERIVTFALPKKDKKKLADFPDMQDATITCRLIKIDLPNGEKEILCTSLVDSEKYTYEEFNKLCHYRWNEEEAYKLLKSRFDKALNAFDKIVEGTREIIRTGRSNPRKKRPKQLYSMNYKRL